jgi:NnrU protein
VAGPAAPGAPGRLKPGPAGRPFEACSDDLSDRGAAVSDREPRGAVGARGAGQLLARLGRPGFYSASSLLATVSLSLVLWAFQSTDPGPWLCRPVAGARIIAPLVMPFAPFLMIARHSTPAASDHAHGICRIATVPDSLGVLLWTRVHLLSLGEARAVILFGAAGPVVPPGVRRQALPAAPPEPRRGSAR